MAPPRRPETAPPPAPGGGDPERPRRRGRPLRLAPKAPDGGGRLGSRAGALSLLLHVVAGVVVFQLLTFGHGMRWFSDEGDRDQPQERLTYVEPARPPSRSSAPPRVAEAAPARGGAPQLTAPDQVPTTLPAPPRGDTGTAPAPRPRADGGVGAAAPEVRGARPDYADPRVWQPPAYGYGVERRDGADNLDSIMAFAITAARDSLDSLARAQGRTGRAPGDWTKTDKNGNRWGWDQQGIRLGKVTIPNALLGLLPLNAAMAGRAAGNYTAMERERRISASREDILRMSERSMGEAEFRRVVKEMNARRDADRRDRLRAPSASVAAPVRSEGKPPAP